MTAEPADESIHAAARAYAARGWSVVAVEPRGKRPWVAWLDFQHRIATAHEIDAWFRHRPGSNVAIVTGRVSGLVVVDVDPRHGGDASLAAIERQFGALPPTVEALTGGGGRHLYFAHPGGVLHNRVGLRPGIDLRGDGGCIVAPPSVHPSGARYVWVAGRGPDDVAPARLPSWALGAAHAGGGHSLAHWRELVREGVDEGARNASVASLTGHLLWHGIDPAVALELMLAWNRLRCRPPLADAEVAGVVQNIVRLHERDGGAGAAPA